MHGLVRILCVAQAENQMCIQESSEGKLLGVVVDMIFFAIVM